MANAWDESDLILQNVLQRYMDSIDGDADWRLKLFKNDFTPIPGTDVGDFVEADFTGYAFAPVNTSGWESVTVTDHVASTTHTTAATFSAGSTGFSSQTIYGYWIESGDGDYLVAERFETPRVIHPDDVLKVTAVLKHKTATA